MNFAFDRALFISAHADDVEFGCGGTIARYRSQTNIRIVILSVHSKSSQGVVQSQRDLNESYRAIKELDLPRNSVSFEDVDGQLFQENRQKIREILIRWNQDFAPDIIFSPALKDLHQDHQVTCEEALRIFRRRTCLGYEVLNSSFSFTPTLFVSLDKEHLNRKVAAVMCYKESQASQNISGGYYFRPEMIWGLAYHRGAQAGCDLAEAFEVYSMHAS